jgi:hypothetical protein
LSSQILDFLTLKTCLLFNLKKILEIIGQYGMHKRKTVQAGIFKFKKYVHFPNLKKTSQTRLISLFFKEKPHPKIQTKLSKLQICFQFSLIIKFV